MCSTAIAPLSLSSRPWCFALPLCWQNVGILYENGLGIWSGLISALLWPGCWNLQSSRYSQDCHFHCTFILVRCEVVKTLLLQPQACGYALTSYCRMQDSSPYLTDLRTAWGGGKNSSWECFFVHIFVCFVKERLWGRKLGKTSALIH